MKKNIIKRIKNKYKNTKIQKYGEIRSNQYVNKTFVIYFYFFSLHLLCI